VLSTLDTVEEMSDHSVNIENGAEYPRPMIVRVFWRFVEGNNMMDTFLEG